MRSSESERLPFHIIRARIAGMVRVQAFFAQDKHVSRWLEQHSLLAVVVVRSGFQAASQVELEYGCARARVDSDLHELLAV